MPIPLPRPSAWKPLLTTCPFRCIRAPSGSTGKRAYCNSQRQGVVHERISGAPCEPRRVAENPVLCGPGVLLLPDRHRRGPSPVDTGDAGRTRRHSADAGVPELPGAWLRRALAATGLGSGAGGHGVLLLSVVFRGGFDPALG